jgi:hypothetical protein
MSGKLQPRERLGLAARAECPGRVESSSALGHEWATSSGAIDHGSQTVKADKCARSAPTATNDHSSGRTVTPEVAGSIRRSRLSACKHRTSRVTNFELSLFAQVNAGRSRTRVRPSDQRP